VSLHRIFEKARTSPASLRFSEVQRLAEALGLHLSLVRGSHHIYSRPGVTELVNLQDVSGMAKPYQVRQLLRLAARYNLDIEG
jgi:predicted RNA binding protein YcfA (HicA-like mRNA interferase family)